MKLLRVKEAADRLGVKLSSVRQLAERGILSHLRDWNGHRRFKEEDVEAVRKRLCAGKLNEERSKDEN